MTSYTHAVQQEKESSPAADKTTQTAESKTPEQQSVEANKQTSDPVEKSATLAPPIKFLQQQHDDIKHYLEPDIINSILVGMKEHVLLISLNKTGIAKGVVILLPDWQQGATSSKALNHLRLQFPKQGWTTIAIQPPAKPDNYPSIAIDHDKQIEFNQKALTDYQNDLAEVLKQVTEKANEYPGIIVTISEGSNAALLTNIYHQELVAAPSALVLLSSFLPTAEANKMVAESISQLAMPVLDLTLFRDNIYVNNAAQLRSDAVKQEMKPHYRQKQLHNINPNYYPKAMLLKEINGWLAAIGW